MSKLTGRSKKDIFYPSTGLEKDRNNKPVKKLTGENTGEIKKDKAGKDYSLVRETTENFVKGDTIRPGNVPRVDNFIQGGDYKVKETPESKKRATDEPRTFTIKDDYSSMRSMGQAVAKWTSPLAQKKHTKEQRDQLFSQKKYPVKGAADIQVEGRYVASPDLINEGNDPGKIPFKPTKSATEFSKDHGSGKRDAQGNFEYVTTYDSSNFPTKKKNPNYLSKPQPGSDPRAAANTKLGVEKPIPIGIRKPEDTPAYTGKPKPKAKPKAEPLEKVEKRGGKGFEGFTRTNLMGPSQPGDSDYQTNIVSKGEEAQDRERKDMARMQRAVDSANAPEKLMAGLSRKEKRQMARYDRKKERGLTPEKAVKATETVQTIGSFLADLKPGGTDVEKAGVVKQPKQPKKDKEDKNKPGNDGTEDLTDLGKTLITIAQRT